MSGDGDNVGKRAIDSRSSYFLHLSDYPGAVISSCILKGENYYLWVKALRNALKAKNKLGFIDGSITVPDASSVKDDASSVKDELWEMCNSMLVTWIFNVIDLALQPSVAYAETTRELWTDMRDRFSIGNAPRIYQLKTEIAMFKQKELNVVAYYTKLKGMWDELSGYLKVPPCTCGAASEFLKEREEEKTYQFLMGLDDVVFGTICSQILGMDPLPSLNCVYAVVSQEERHRAVTRAKDERNENTAFAVQARGRQSFGAAEKKFVGERPVCPHCGKFGHEVARCFEVMGYPPCWGTNRGRGRVGDGGDRDNIGSVGRGLRQSGASMHVVVQEDERTMVPGLSTDKIQRLPSLIEPNTLTV